MFSANPPYIDSLILKSLRQDDEKALNYLFSTYYNKLYRMGLKWSLDSDLSKECIQLIFKDLWQYRHTLSDIESFEAYLMASLRKRVAKEIQKQKPFEQLDLNSLEKRQFPTQSYEEILILQETNETNKVQIQKALNELSPRQKEIIVLKYFEELSYKEICERTGLQVDTLYKVLHEALKKLRIVLVK
jgi:RNA polymerase sigma factor (sigma-70 family)